MVSALHHKQRLLLRDDPRLRFHRLAQELGDGEHAPVRDASVRKSQLDGKVDGERQPCERLVQ